MNRDLYLLVEYRPKIWVIPQVSIQDTMEICITTALEGGFVTAILAADSSRSLWPSAPLQLQFSL